MSSKQIFLQIYKDLELGKIELPTLPDLAIKIRQTLKDETTPIREVTKIISIDPTLTAYLIKIANSPIYIGVEKCSDVQSAVIRLGYQSTRNIVMTFTMRSMFRAKLSKQQPILSELWLNVSKLAAISSVLATRCSNFDPDKALTAAMMQDIGALPIIQKLSRIPDIFNQPTEVNRIIEAYTAKVGALLLHKWNFEDEMIEAVRSRKDWMRDKSPQADLADIILIARFHCYVGTAKMRKCPPLRDIPAFKKLPFGELDAEQSLLILEHAKEDVNAIKMLLPVPAPVKRKRSGLL